LASRDRVVERGRGRHQRDQAPDRKFKTCVWRWQERFMQEGVGGLLATRVAALTQTDPPAEATHWTATMMAKAAGISASSVQHIWRSHGLQAHRARQFKLSNDPNFVGKLHDVVGLYVSPPEHAIVLSRSTRRAKSRRSTAPSQVCP
jgi:hypothetical protein